MADKTKKIIVIILAIFFVLQIAFFILFLLNSNPKTSKPVVKNPVTPTNQLPVTPPVTPVPIEDNQEGSSTSEEKLTIITQGQLKLVSRNILALESTLASRIPENDKIVRFISGGISRDVDTSQFEKAMVDNTTYEFKYSALKGKFIDPTNTSYLLQLQIPAQGGNKSTFKWFLFDTNLQLIYKLNLKEKGLDLPSKIVEAKDYDNDAKDEILLEKTRYLNPDNFSSPRYLFKAVNDKQLALVWREETTRGDVDSGRCSSVTKIVFDQSNPPPPNNPELISIKKIYTSQLSAGSFSNTNYNNLYQYTNIPTILNNVTYEEIREYPDRQETYQKILDIYYYTWDANKSEFVYTKKESRNLDVNLN